MQDPTTVPYRAGANDIAIRNYDENGSGMRCETRGGESGGGVFVLASGGCE